MQQRHLPLGTQICRALKARGVRTVFGIPGVHNQELYRGIEDAGISHVLARHEQGAGFMADGYARTCGAPGVAFVISGPGLTNILTPIGQAHSDSVPMLVIATCISEAETLRGNIRLHELKDQRLTGESAADWSLVAADAEAAYKLIDRAFTEFACARPLPKIINVPVGLLAEPAPAPPKPPIRPGRLFPDPGVLEQVAELLRAAERPLFIFGGGSTTAFEAARAVVEKSSGAVFMTYAGRGVIQPEYGLNLGSLLARSESAKVAANADLVIAVGTSLSETDLWREELGHSCRMIRVDVDPSAFLNLQQGDIPVLSDAGHFLGSLLPLVQSGGGGGWSHTELARTRSMMLNSCNAERPGIADVALAVSRQLPAGTRVFSDMTQFAYVAKEVVDLDAPGQWHHPCGFGTLGYALPAAIGGKVAQPNLPVLAIAGDYGLQYTIQELGTLVDIGLPVALLVWDNAGLKEIELSMIRSQIQPTATSAFMPDLKLLAQSFGLHYQRPSSVPELAEAVGIALKKTCSTLIHADVRQLGVGNR
ncbi:MAG: acetolactate synthase isozyme1 large subunit [Rhodobacteraceae bacterium]|nr:acetolactate synthase isozyme1 large subunit [Paracoccaceae bacterium]